MPRTSLDSAIQSATAWLTERSAPRPDGLLLLGTGLGTLVGQLANREEWPLHDLPGAPPVWQEATLHRGTCSGAELWLLEDSAGDLPFEAYASPERPAWERGFPVWLAAAAGSPLLLQTSAGHGLHDGYALGDLMVIEDHINVSGSTPLLGLGSTRLGPLFPDQTSLHHPGLRHRAQEGLLALGAELPSGVAACLAGPSLATPAELRWLSQTPAQVAIQDVAGPWIAAAHAGMSLLALTVIGSLPSSKPSMTDLLTSMNTSAPLLEDLLLRLLPELPALAHELRAEV